MVPLSSRHQAVFELISPIPFYLSPLAANDGLWEIIRTENRIEEEVDDVVAISTCSLLTFEERRHRVCRAAAKILVSCRKKGGLFYNCGHAQDIDF